MKVSDLEQQGITWVFKLRPNDIRSLKTEETARDVPVHPVLLGLGILDLRTGRKPDDLLIPNTPRGEGKAFNAAQKQMGRLVRKFVSQDLALTFHSLRHSFRDAMRDAGLARSIEERLGGWKSTGGEAMEGYGSGHKMSKLFDELTKVVYEGVDIT